MIEHPTPESLSAYLDGGPNDDRAPAVRQHLTACAECARTVAAISSTLAEMRAIEEPAMPAEASRALRAAIARARARNGRRWRWAAATAGAAAAIVSVVVLTVGGEKPGGADATLASGLGSTPAITIGDSFDDASARSLLSGAAEGADAAAPKSFSAPAGRSSGQMAPLTVDYAPAIGQCERSLFEEETSSRRAIIYEVADWVKGGRRTPAFFLVYSVRGSGPARTELWVVERRTCETLYFAQSA